MNITEAKKRILDMLKESGFKVISPKEGSNDFRVLVAPKVKSILVISTSETLTAKDDSFFIEFCKTAEIPCTVLKEGAKITFHNPDWDVDETQKGNKAGKNVIALPELDGAKTKRAYVRKNKSSEPSPHLTPVINEEVTRLRALADDLGDILDSFKLAKLSVREIASQLYDALKEEGIYAYSSKVEIKFSGNSLVVPHLTKEAFIAMCIKVIAPQKVQHSFRKAVEQ